MEQLNWYREGGEILTRNRTPLKFVRDKINTKKKRRFIKRARQLLQAKIESIRAARKAAKERFERKLKREKEFITDKYTNQIGRLFEACKRHPVLAAPTQKPIEIMGCLVRRTEHQLIIASKKLTRSINIPWNPIPDYEDASLN